MRRIDMGHRRIQAAGALSLLGLTAVLTGATAATASVPPPTADTSVVTVKVGADRTGTQNSDVSPLPGVQLGLFATADAATPINGTWALCTSDADGDCNFVVPATGVEGANRNLQPFVKQIAVPAGWFMNPALRTGPGSGSGSQATPYQFQTPPLQGGNTYSSTSDFMFSTDNVLRSSSIGIWQQSRVNPTLDGNCGLDVALLLDLSASVGSNLPNLKAAADTFADSLVGTPSRMAVFSFSATSPSAGADANHPDLVSVSTQSGADTFKAQYANWQIAPGTNWDQGLFQVAQAQPHYEVLVVLTDGNPTRYGANPLQGDGSNTHFRDVETGIFSANAVKAEGTRVLAVGVGAGVTGITALNLAAISGPVAFDGSNTATADYYQTSDYAQAGEALRELALTRCTGGVSVVKQIVPATNTGEDVTGATPAGPGWEFTATTTTPGIGGLPDSQPTTSDGTGSVAFELEYPAGTPTAEVTVTETQQTGHTLVTPGGNNAVCVNLENGAPVAVTNTGDAGSPGFTIDVASTAAVSCTVYNRPLPAATITVQKRWIIDGTTYENGNQPDGFTARLTLTGPGSAGPMQQEFGSPRSGYVIGSSTTIDESTTLRNPNCRIDSRRITGRDGEPVDLPVPHTATLTQPSTSYTITNRVTCTGLPVTGSSTTSVATVGGILLATGAGLVTVAALWRRRPVRPLR
ncbi:hypothetical protein GCM10027290_51490 [Micromonospora sonneratiae]|uniref:VWFA domain-containing protein n=1 Tax=Micromonospora sonneratiae TaxID=1184706 RepID=A0ABW3YCH5_9ACTN